VLSGISDDMQEEEGHTHLEVYRGKFVEHTNVAASCAVVGSHLQGLQQRLYTVPESIPRLIRNLVLRGGRLRATTYLVQTFEYNEVSQSAAFSANNRNVCMQRI
jgi:hypothetical protein